MDPYEYEASYHFVPLVDWRMGLFGGAANITRYLAGWATPEALALGAPDTQAEYDRVMKALVRRLGVRGIGAVPRKFNFTDDLRVDPSEDFYQMTIRRSYEGRASPSEMADTIRIVYLLGLINFPIEASAYANKFFAQDCNSFVGNYLGVSPYVPIRAYAHGFGNGAHIQGATTDIYTCRGFFPLPPVADIDSIGTGTVLVTYGDPDKKGNRWRHIGLVQDFTPTMGVGGARTGGDILISEWGKAGGSSSHRSAGKIKLIHYQNPELPGKTFLAYRPDVKHYGKDEVRIFFDSSRMMSNPNRGWHVCNPQGGLVYDG